LKYDSSVFPVKTPLYGIPNAPRYPYFLTDEHPFKDYNSGDFLEIPLATLRVPMIGNIPIAGGFYLRFLPTTLIKFGIKKMNDKNQPAMFYIHPKDLDPGFPKISEYTWHYYWGLKHAEKKFESILKKFKFSSVQEELLEKI